MIHDRFSFLSRLEGLGPRWQAATQFLAQPNLADLPDGRTDLILGEVWAVVMRRPGREANAAQFEVHRRFADIQCCVFGREQLGWSAAPDSLRIAQPFDAEKDVEMRHGPVTEFLPLSPGWFAVLFPGEPHAPLIGEGLLTKVVIKVLVE